MPTAAGSPSSPTPASWSPDSRHIAGTTIRTADDAQQEDALVYDTVTHKYEVLSPHGGGAGWMPGGKSFLLVEKGKLKALDLATHKTSDLPVPVNLGDDGWNIAVSSDAKYIYWAEKRREADIWRVTLAE